jgi:hypothetical protein
MPDVSTSWAEGRFADRWLFVHLMSGVAGGLFNAFLAWPRWQIVVVGAALMILWELVEIACRIRESPANRVIDVVVGVVGVSAGLWVQGAVTVGAGRALWVGALGLTLLGTALGVRHRAMRRRRAERASE